jgi:hypothetical protein
VATALDGTLSGTFDQATMTNDGDDGTLITYVHGNEATSVAGTTTGDYQLEGTEIEIGARTLLYGID